MANQWNGTIATQTVPFRGTSSVTVKTAFPEFPESRRITNSTYGVNVTGGVSGGFGVFVIGNIGGHTYFIAGVTNITAIGSYVLYPAVYAPTGGLSGTFAVGANLGDAVRLDQTVPPSKVLFQGGTATAGISAACTVGAVLSIDQ